MQALRVNKYMELSLSEKIIEILKRIPKGKVATYGMIAAMAGNPKAARTVSFILSSSSKKYNLPWHRIINSKGTISLKEGQGFELQKKMLESEGLVFKDDNSIDLRKWGWNPQ